MSQRFDVFVSSAVEGVCKPDRVIYLRACEKIGSKPQNCLFMDDSQENIMGAQMVGMQAIHWSGKENGFREFSAFLVNRESFMASHDFEKFMEVNDGA